MNNIEKVRVKPNFITYMLSDWMVWLAVVGIIPSPEDIPTGGITIALGYIYLAYKFINYIFL